MSGAIDQATDELGGEIDKLRALITELRPAALDELGLMAAIEALTERSATTAGLDIKTEFALPETWGRERLDPELESTVYRLVQEALTNVVKHARAERVDLQVSMNGDAVTVTVRDDGIGFDPATTSEGFGLVGMRERLELIGGRVDISSAPGQGTEVRAELPVPSESRPVV